MGPFNLEKIKLAELYDYAARAADNPVYQTALPITPVRARSQTENPYGHPDDIALLAVHAENKCAGYIGLLPGQLYDGRQRRKVFFTTTLYVSPEFRGRGIADRLLAGVKKLGVDVVFTGISKRAEVVHRRIGFQFLGQLDYYRLEFDRICQDESLGSKLKTAMIDNNIPAETSLSIIDAAKPGNTVRFKQLYYPMILASAVPATRLTCRAINRISDKFTAKGSASSAVPEFLRGPQVVNWMLQYPWVTELKANGSRRDNYYFTSSREQFKYLAFEYDTPGQARPAGYFVISVSTQKFRTTVKLLDCLAKQSAYYDSIGFTLLDFARKYQADHIVLPKSLAGLYKQNVFLKPFLKKRKRRYEFHPGAAESPLTALKDCIRLNYCDADIAFT